MKMRKTFSLYALAAVLSAFSAASSLYAQEIGETAGYEYADSVIFRPACAVDSTLIGIDVFDAMPSRAAGDKAGVGISQSPAITASMRAHIASNSSRSINGYRVRIFFDNRQTARAESEQTLMNFRSMFNDIAAYRTYSNPYFKVTVGDCRTKSEAMALLARIKPSFPGAFVVKEPICYPAVDKNNAFVTDTVRILIPKSN